MQFYVEVQYLLDFRMNIKFIVCNPIKIYWT